MNATCYTCGAQLNETNWSPSSKKKRDYICKACQGVKAAKWAKENPKKMCCASERRRRKKGILPIGKNKKSPQYLGIYIAERILSKVFKDVKQMPYGNCGFDFICNRGKKIDVKSSVIHTSPKQSSHWSFLIKKNKIAEYFLCLAFDNRESLNPEHVWLIPARDVNHKTGMKISVTTLDKWSKYELNKLNNVIACCDTIRNL